ncbi:GntR family transcriptional regulator [Planococcaceae bacterium Storch 2/2-2]|nr:GntR family transcriptional regulator [Planococcaceae bacterium Storch 2/2-2]
MDIFISHERPEPLYAQIVEQVKEQIARGVLEPDEQLPSIRNLAKQLEVSVITTKRAYEELENEGLIYSVHGRGSFIRAQANNAKTEWLRLEFEKKLEAVLQEGRLLGLTANDIRLLIDVYLEEEETK